MDANSEQADQSAILDYWLNEVGPKGWYSVDKRVDDEITERFLGMWESASVGEARGWMTRPRGCLALLILLDQFPRNMFRGQAKAFSTDARALSAASMALTREDDRAFEMPARQFFYLPFMHAESLGLQERAVRLFVLNDPGGDNIDHARAHRWVIRKFGRFPYRNEALGRETTPPEAAFLEDGGYAAAMRAVAAA